MIPCLPCAAAAAAAGPPGWALMAVAGGAAYVWQRARSSGTRTSGFSSDVTTADATVRAVLGDVAPSLRHVILAIGFFESGYGLAGSWLRSDGSPSYNWGALVGSGTAGSISHHDVDRDGHPYTTDFQAHASMADGLRSFMKTFSRDEAVAPATRGDATAVAEALYRHGYFTGSKGTDQARIDLYAQAIVNTAAQIAAALGEVPDVALRVPSSASPAKTALLASAAAGGAYLVGAPLAVVVGAPLAVVFLASRKAA